MPHLEVHNSWVHPTAEGVGCGLIPRHSKCQNLSLVGLYAVHQGSILPVPEAGLASAVPGDDGHVKVIATHQTMVTFFLTPLPVVILGVGCPVSIFQTLMVFVLPVAMWTPSTL